MIVDDRENGAAPVDALEDPVPAADPPGDPVPPADPSGGPVSSADPPGDTVPLGDPVPAADEPQPQPPPSTAITPVNDPGRALPVLARSTAGLWLRAAAWGAGTTLRLGARLAHAASDPEAASQLYDEMADGLRNYAREFLGIEELDREMRLLAPLAGAALQRADDTDSEASLRARGEELLRAAASVGFDQRAHPAYARILTELSPDEARILKLLAVSGPQPLVDVRAANLIGLGSQLVAASMNMLGAQSGARSRDRVPIYLTNLSRLGLIVLSDEELDDPIAYQVLEAQPDVLATVKQTARAKVVRRSVLLTPLGQDFCEVCLPLELPALPAAEQPSDAADRPPHQADPHAGADEF